jgi:protein TonB
VGASDRGTGGTERGGDLSAAIVSGTGGGLGDATGTEYAGYLARVRERIQESLRYPPAARRRGVTGTVQLEISIGTDGAIAAVAVDTSSSHEILDRAAMEAARSTPRVPFPADVRPAPLRVRLPVRFELQ